MTAVFQQTHKILSVDSPKVGAAKSILHHVMNNAEGASSSTVKVEIHKLQLEPADRVLLCSDALTQKVSEDQINEILYTAAKPEDTCLQLVASQ